VGQLREFHRPRIEVLAASGADLLAFETLPCAAEVEAVLAEIDESGLECWVAVSIHGGRTRAGDMLSDVFSMIADVSSVVALGVNCSTPSDATAAVGLAAQTGRPVIIYPNSGEGWDAVNRQWVAADAAPHFPVERWVAEGARLVGGCCRVTPADISAMAVQLDQ
jgi:homocysteine S-methyltransferase